jgi:hypothetical protein
MRENWQKQHLERRGIGGIIVGMRRIQSGLACICFFIIPALAKDPCIQSPDGECFAFHGRFTVYTGDGQEVLWPVGTRRFLRAESGDEPLLNFLAGNNMKNLVRNADDYVIFGDFVVCPLEKETPGAIRSVCIKNFKNLRLVRRSK